MEIILDGKHGERLGELLRLAFRSQQEAATALEVSQSTISYWKSMPVLRQTFFIRYADVFRACGLNPDYILNPEAPMLIGKDLPKNAIEMVWRVVKLEAELNDLRKQMSHE